MIRFNILIPVNLLIILAMLGIIWLVMGLQGVVIFVLIAALLSI